MRGDEKYSNGKMVFLKLWNLIVLWYFFQYWWCKIIKWNNPCLFKAHREALAYQRENIKIQWRAFAQISKHISASNQQEFYQYYINFPASKQMTTWLLKQLCANVMMNDWKRLSNVTNFAIGDHCRIGGIVNLDLLSFGKQIQQKI